MSLHLIIGPMFSGKTTRLIELSKSFSAPIFINYLLDKRYHHSLLSTHDGIMVPCIQSLDLSSILENTKEADAIFINEGQFFQDLVDCVKTLVEIHNKKVYVCGLDGDFLRNPFGDILSLIPLCDTLEKRSAKCICGSPAHFTYRNSSHKEVIVIGTTEYNSLCRTCYLSR